MNEIYTVIQPVHYDEIKLEVGTIVKKTSAWNEVDKNVKIAKFQVIGSEVIIPLILDEVKKGSVL